VTAIAIRGSSYPILLPKLSDPRLHLASVIISLQVLGQAAFGFQLSIAQILISVGTCALLEMLIALRQQRVIMWPASAMLTGNGVAFVLRVPGTQHGDWWSTRGWWIFAGTAAVSLLSKHVIRIGGRHIFNPSNFGLVVCLLIFGSGRVEPLNFWWAPLSAWMVLALCIIVAGGLAILLRIGLFGIAAGFWLAFAGGLAVLAATSHTMTSRWHLGPLSGWAFWSTLVTSPEILVFLFFMITDPKTIPRGRRARLLYAVSIGLLAVLLIAPAATEWWSKVAVLGSLSIVCAAMPALERLPRLRLAPRRLPVLAAAALAAYAGVLVVAGSPARSAGSLPTGPLASSVSVQVAHTTGVASISPQLGRQIAAVALADLKVAPGYRVRSVGLRLVQAVGQAPPTVVATLRGASFTQQLHLALANGRFVLVGDDGRTPATAPTVGYVDLPKGTGSFSKLRLVDVAPKLGLAFRQGAFRYSMAYDPQAMMGGGVCWLDYDNDGRLDLFAVNSYADVDQPEWASHGGLPQSALFHNVGGKFVNVSRSSHAGIRVKGTGCVAADLNGDGYTDVVVTSATGVEILWNTGHGTFTHTALPARYGWYSGAAVADVNGDGRPDVFVAGYTNMDAPISNSIAGFPTNYQGVRDLLFLNMGNAPGGRARFKEVGVEAGLESTHFRHGLGAIFTDVNGDGRPDLYVANDEDPNDLYLNEKGGPLGFHFVDAASAYRVADHNAGMGVAEADINGDGRPDLFVTNSRGQPHAAYVSGVKGGEPTYLPEAAKFAKALDRAATVGWGDSWIDFANSGSPDLILANGAIPLTNLKKDTEPIQVLQNEGDGRFTNASGIVGGKGLPRIIGRGLAAADFANDGRIGVAINTIGGPLVLLEETGPVGHWLEVSLKGFQAGAVLTATLPNGRSLVEELHAGSSYLSSEDPRAHFGLGGETKIAKLTIRWPDGRVSHLTNLAADRIVTVSPPTR
jgi:Na+-translocating ferredoxin:NAD+ oxidoreductase RnfD subunit